MAITQSIKIETEGGEKLVEQFAELVKVTGKAVESLVKVGDAGTQAAGGLDTTSKALAQISTAGEQAVGLLGKFSSAANQLASIGAQVGEKLTAVAAGISEFGAKISAAAGRMRELAGEAGGATGVVGEVGAKIGEAAGKIVEFSGKVTEVAGTLGGFAAKAAELGVQITLTTTLLVSMGVTWGTVSGTIVTGFVAIRTAALAAGASMTLAFGPIGVVLLLITGLIVAVAAAWAAWGPSVEATAEAVSAAWQRLATAVDASIAQVKQLITDFVTTPAGAAWQWIADTASSVWEQVTALAQQAWDAVVEFVTTAPGSAWQWIVDTASSVWEQVTALAQQAWDAVVSFVTTPVADAWQWIVDAWNAMLQKLGFGGGKSAATPADGGGSGLAGGGLLGGRGTGTSDSNLAWVSRGEYVVPARIVRQPGMLAFLEALRLQRFAGGGLIPSFADGGGVNPSALKSVGDAMSRASQIALTMARHVAETLNSVAESIDKAFIDMERSLDKTLEGLGSRIDDAFRGLVDATWNSFEQLDKTLAGAVETLKGFGVWGGMAAGGLLGGRGTGTSDSNLAWLSRGEFVVPAHAVRRPGVLQMLEALRLGGLRGFALGGLAMGPMALPALASGGGGVPRNLGRLELGLPGGGTVVAYTDDRAVEAMRRAAALGQIRSGGRKPSRYS